MAGFKGTVDGFEKKVTDLSTKVASLTTSCRNKPVACPCVFKALGWARQALSTKELFHIFDTPLAMDEVLLSDRRGRVVM